MRGVRLGLGAAGLLLAGSTAAVAEPVIIRCKRPCTAVVQAIESNGGVVRYRYKYVDAIAAEVARPALRAVRSLVEPGAVRKDFVVQLPRSPRDPGGTGTSTAAASDSVAPLGAAGIRALAGAGPSAYPINDVTLNLGPLFAANLLGQGMKVALIDSGIRPGFPHISLDGSVIGGEDLVGDGLGFSNAANSGHGTFMAGMVSANVLFTVGGPLLDTVATHCPSCLGPAANNLAMIGTAPASSLYALRVLPPGGGAPESRIIAAMERVLELRARYDAGHAETPDVSGRFDALNIRVCNMSLGGPVLYAGRDIEDQLTQAFLEHDIVLTTSAGNTGPSGTTGSSPGTGFGALTVGASSSAVHERILRDLQFGLGIGSLYRPFDGTQTAFLSGRGPTADGRVDPEVVANGFASFGQGFGTGGTIDLATGTSSSSASLAGIAAVLRQAVPTATARQVRNAIILSANPALVADGSGPLDRGAGHADAAAAYTLLAGGTAPDTAGAAGGTNKNVSVNILQGAGVPTFTDVVTRSVTGLQPGQRFETYYKVPSNTSAIVVTLSGVTPGDNQNVLFGDNILLTVHSAKTSAADDYQVFQFTSGGMWTIPDPDAGLMRVTLSGNWTNASPIGATVTIAPRIAGSPGQTVQAALLDGQTKVYPFTVPPGAASLGVRLEWDGHWGVYPTNDLDLILIPPSGPENVAGATLNAPERVAVANPVPGQWIAVVDGFSIATKNGDKFSLRVAIDGTVLK
jgi:hypothetical protein